MIEAAPARAQAPAQTEEFPATQALPVSAASGAALGQQLRRLSGWLGERPGLELADVAHTLAVGRATHDYRRALTCTDLDDAARQLADAATTGAERAKGRPRVVFLLPGIGDQYPGIGLDLYRAEPVYAEAVDRCLAALQQRSGTDLRPLFFPAAGLPGPAASRRRWGGARRSPPTIRWITPRSRIRSSSPSSTPWPDS